MYPGEIEIFGQITIVINKKFSKHRIQWMVSKVKLMVILEWVVTGNNAMSQIKAYQLAD